MLTIEEIKKALDAGETVELECVDGGSLLRSGWHLSHIDINKEMLKSKNLIVTDIYKDSNSRYVSINCDEYRLLARELRYFRIKRPVPTFNDLIDTAVQANKDKVLPHIELRENEIYLYKFGIVKDDVSCDVFANAISDINSLYTETFVIESEEDEKKIQPPVKSIILANGQEIIGEESLSLLKDGLHLKAGAHGNIKIPFALLKGSTVTQKRGAL